jgi:hemerythrin-like domain-containing protein
MGGRALVLAGCAGAMRGESDATLAAGHAEVTPAEDLMFEHGVIERMLLVYDEAARRIDAGDEVPVSAIATVAGLSRRFTEDYHARLLEEQQVFPRFEKAGQYIELVRTLKAQHDAGRRVTDQIMQWTLGGAITKPQQLAAAMRSYSRMYMPHAAREETVLFKAFQALLPAEEYRVLGEQFED